MEERTCKHCIHFYQHYVLDEQFAVAACCGHCVYSQMKQRRPNTSACQHFEARTECAHLPDRRGTIHFLTTKVLEYILSLELPPNEK